MNTHIASRLQSPRPDTPEPDIRQGRRNLQGGVPGVQLLDDDGGISDLVCLLVDVDQSMYS